MIIVRCLKSTPSTVDQARHLFGSQTPLTTGGFELQISSICIRSNYRNH